MLKKIKPLESLLLITFFLLLILFLLNKSIAVKKIILISPYRKIDGLSVFNRQNLLFLNDQKIIRFLLSKNIFIENIDLKIYFPGTVVLDIKWRQPVAVISGINNPILIDGRGFPAFTDNTKDSSLPQIYISNVSFNYQTPDWRLKKAVTLINNLNKNDTHISRITINVDSGLITAFVDGGTEIYIPLSQDPMTVSASLQTIILRFRIEGKFIASIDYRFAKPVVILKNE